MTKKDKKQFVTNLIKNVKKDIMKNIDDFPEDWDGIELRWYIRYMFNCVVWQRIDRRNKRHKEFINAIILNDW